MLRLPVRSRLSVPVFGAAVSVLIVSAAAPACSSDGEVVGVGGAPATGGMGGMPAGAGGTPVIGGSGGALGISGMPGLAGSSGAAGAAAGSGGSAGSGGATGSAGAAGSGGSSTGTGSSTCGRNPGLATGRIQMENLCRGVVAARAGSNNFVSWRMFGYEPATVAYNVYRGGMKVNPAPIANSTNYLDMGAPANATYTVRAVLDGAEQGDSEQATTWAQNYLDIRLTPPSGYAPGDTSAGDLDGDGNLELVVKWEQSPQDNANSGRTGTTKLEGVEFDGMSKWRIDLGMNIREGAHYTQFMVYDLDGDGDSELVVKTAPGTRDGTGAFLKTGPAANDNDSMDYRNASGYVLSGPEYLTVFDGRTGAELATVNFEIPRGTVASWGDSYGNRVDRFLGAVAFVGADGRPSVLMARGYYTRSTITAWNFRDGQLSKLWTADSSANTNYTGQGAHSISIADVDNDGKQEVIYGASMIQDDGTRGCTTDEGHGDALHTGDFIPSRPGLEVFMPHEYSGSRAFTMRDAATCAIIFQGGVNSGEGPGRGVAADVNPMSPGAEAWTNSSTALNNSGGNGGARPPSTNFLIWWDGDESRELLDSNRITKYPNTELLQASGCQSINGTKSTPNLSGDLIGDWREEVIFRCGTNLRLYTTTATTTRRIYTLLHDPQYRSAISWQNVAYNQPPHPSFAIGAGMAEPPRPDITVR